MSHLQFEDPTADSPASPTDLPRLALGGAICGSFAGSFAGAFLGILIGVVYRDISLGLDGAILGSIIAAAAGGSYGLILALREKRGPLFPGETPSLEQRGHSRPVTVCFRTKSSRR